MKFSEQNEVRCGNMLIQPSEGAYIRDAVCGTRQQESIVTVIVHFGNDLIWVIKNYFYLCDYTTFSNIIQKILCQKSVSFINKFLFSLTKMGIFHGASSTIVHHSRLNMTETAEYTMRLYRELFLYILSTFANENKSN